MKLDKNRTSFTAKPNFFCLIDQPAVQRPCRNGKHRDQRLPGLLKRHSKAFREVGMKRLYLMRHLRDLKPGARLQSLHVKRHACHAEPGEASATLLRQTPLPFTPAPAHESNLLLVLTYRGFSLSAAGAAKSRRDAILVENAPLPLVNSPVGTKPGK